MTSPARFALLGSLLAVALGLSLLDRAHAQPAKPAEAQWIWFNEGDPVSGAPSEIRYFRRVFTIDSVPKSAELHITADNAFAVWLNGMKVGEGDQWQQLYQFNLKSHLKVGKNILAVEARNEGGPAGLVVKLGDLVVSDKSWRASKTPGKGWQTLIFDEQGWSAVHVIGPFGKVGPWSGAAVGGPAKPRTFTVPDGFKVEPAVVRPDNRGPFSLVNMTFDAKGRLLLSQEGGPTLLCTGADRDGVYHRVVDYCSQVKNSQGMCWVNDALLLVGDGPKGTGLYRCKDTDGDDKTDEITLLHKFQGGMGEHGPHAVIHGPDNWIYLVIGNHAFAQPEQLADNSPLTRWPKGSQGPDQGQPGTTEDVLLPRQNDANGHAANIRAPGGTIWRFDHEGKNASLVAAGFRNQYDAAFLSSGELFTFDSDMEWDEGLPWYRHVRVCHCPPGADFLWRTGAANTPNYYLDSLPPLYETGRGSPVGVETYEHTAFPKKYHGAVFVCDWSIGVIYAVHLKPTGGTYKAEVEKFCTGSPLNVTDCAVGPDGALWFTTGGRGSQGGVYRIVYQDKQESKSYWPFQPLSAWSRDVSREVIDKSISKRGKKATIETLEKEILPDKDAPLTTRRDANLVLLEMQRTGLSPSAEFLARVYRNPKLRAHAVWLFGVNGYQEGKAVLLEALADKDPLVRRRACEALIRARIEPPVEALGPLLVEDDIYVRTAARLVLERIDPKRWFGRIDNQSNKRLIRESIVALCKTSKAADHAEKIFDLLHEGSPGQEVQAILDHLRTIQLALIHTKDRPGSVRGIAVECLEMFPHKDAMVNRELAILITHLRREKILDEPVHEKLLDEMFKAQDRPQQIHYYYCLRLLHDGWTKERKARILAWYEATRDWKGGASFHPFLANILRDLAPAFGKADVAEVVTKLKELPQSALVLIRSATKDQLPSPKVLRDALVMTSGAKLPRGNELQTALADALARHDTAEARQTLRDLLDVEGGPRDAVLLALARSLDAESWPLVVRWLDTGNKQVLGEMLQALQRSPLKPKAEEAAPFRAAILAGRKLDANNRRLAVTLLRHWAGNKRFAVDDNAWNEELSGWAKWFNQNFPKESPLADVVADKPSESKWKFDELLTYLDGEGKRGDVGKGRLAFEKGQCFKCHRYGKEGEGLGPDLTTVSKRFKRSDMLEAIHYPSRVISDQYRSQTLSTKKGLQYSGLVAVQGDNYTVLLSDGTKVMLKKGEIDQQLASLTSVMPDKLLDLLTREEIRDLFAFLESEVKP